jgi:hypothetical protein
MHQVDFILASVWVGSRLGWVAVFHFAKHSAWSCCSRRRIIAAQGIALHDVRRMQIDLPGALAWDYV